MMKIEEIKVEEGEECDLKLEIKVEDEEIQYQKPILFKTLSFVHGQQSQNVPIRIKEEPDFVQSVNTEIKEKNLDVIESSLPEVQNARTSSYAREEFFCFYCYKIFGTRRLRHLHIKTHHPGFPYQYMGGSIKCKMCDESYSTVESFEGHVQKSHLDVTQKFECGECGIKYQFFYMLKRHMKRSHKEGKIYSCIVCSEIFKSKLLMDTHRKAVHTAERPFECPKCSKAFKKKSHLENHIVSHSDELKFKCPVCGKAFKSKARLCEHKLANHRDTVFKCSFCTRIFAMSKTLKKHMSEHIDGKPHVCYLCPHDDQKAYKSKFGLWYHIKNYHGDSKDKEPFECHVCKKLFTRAEVLESHLRTHEKPKEAVQKRYECDVCQMTFTRNYSLKLHGVRHITEKNFKCELCSKLFRGADQLRRHLKLTHSGECSCIICGDIFANRYALRKHDYTLHKDFTLKCHLCPHRFATKESRLDHVISMHSMAKSDAENCLESETTSKSDCEIVEHAEETLESIIVKTEYEIN